MRGPESPFDVEPGDRAAGVTDMLNRPLRDLRISVTDRCNFRCVYCMPKEVFGRNYPFLPKVELLTFEEITRLARIAIGHGVQKIRLTGGEPLLRKNLHELIAALTELRTLQGRALDVALTTNGSALANQAQALKDAGLTRVSISLDSLDESRFQAMNDVDFPVAKVLRGIDAARAVGLDPVKVNMVVKRGHNDADIVAMARHFHGTGTVLRFIEYMDVGTTNGWQMDQVVPSAEVIERIDAQMPLEPIAAAYPGETATRWAYRDGGGEIGIISSVTGAFCRSCTRARISTDGKLFTCLFATTGHDLRALMRTGCSDSELADALAGLWRSREDRYSELRANDAPRADRKIEMSYIGG